MPVTIPSNSRHILTPTKLNRLTRTLLQTEIGVIWLTGEISNFVAAGSGHWYFTLKDAKAQIRAAMFRQANHRMRNRPKEGDKVLLRASVSLYEPRGDYQLIVEHMEAEGEGALKRELEELKQQLSEEGLFDADKKRPLPKRISRVGVITSASGAALHDVLTVLKRRAPDIEVFVYPSLVQGEQAYASLIAALAQANQRKEVDAVLITRGGGSLEDLWAFNHPELARHIAASSLFVLSAVGHEVDITISDLVADLRAPTPSAAAELLSPERTERLARQRSLLQRLNALVTHTLKDKRNHKNAVYASLRLLHPAKQLQQHGQLLDNLMFRLHTALQQKLNNSKQDLLYQVKRLQREHPQRLLNDNQQKLQRVYKALGYAMRNLHKDKQQRLMRNAGQLHAISPLATLSRGYTITLQDNKAITSATSIDVTQPITTRFYDGDIVSQPDASGSKTK